MVRVIVKSTLLALICSMRPVRRYRVKGGRPGAHPAGIAGGYGTSSRCADTVDQQPRKCLMPCHFRRLTLLVRGADCQRLRMNGINETEKIPPMDMRRMGR